jgi:hypothetical protein
MIRRLLRSLWSHHCVVSVSPGRRPAQYNDHSNFISLFFFTFYDSSLGFQSFCSVSFWDFSPNEKEWVI